MMRFDVLTLFPEMLRIPLETSILGRALEGGELEVGLHDIRDFSTSKHRTVDDSPYGGGAGMVLQVEPVVAALEAVEAQRPVSRRILLSPSGTLFDQSRARELCAVRNGTVVLVCGRYEGVDARVEHFCDEELSIGDYVLGGGELAALVVIEAVARLVPGVLGNAASVVEESLEDGLLEYPQYTRPRDFRGLSVPDVLLGGNHAAIARWRRTEAVSRTRLRRPDLCRRLGLDAPLADEPGSAEARTGRRSRRAGPPEQEPPCGGHPAAGAPPGRREPSSEDGAAAPVAVDGGAGCGGPAGGGANEGGANRRDAGARAASAGKKLLES